LQLVYINGVTIQSVKASGEKNQQKWDDGEARADLARRHACVCA